MEAPNLTASCIPHVITLEAASPDLSVSSVGIVGKAKGVVDSVTQSIGAWKQKILDSLPKNFTIWLIAITCLIVLVAVSRILTLQKSVTELQSRPVVDESMIRVAVRKHLEETVRAMEQHNKAQAMAKQQEDQAKAMEIQRAQQQAMEIHRAQVEAQAKAAAASAAAAQHQESEKTLASKVEKDDSKLNEPPQHPTVVVVQEHVSQEEKHVELEKHGEKVVREKKEVEEKEATDDEEMPVLVEQKTKKHHHRK